MKVLTRFCWFVLGEGGTLKVSIIYVRILRSQQKPVNVKENIVRGCANLKLRNSAMEKNRAGVADHKDRYVVSTSAPKSIESLPNVPCRATSVNNRRGKLCPACNGNQVIYKAKPFFMEIPCKKCNGTGRTFPRAQTLSKI